MEITEQKKGSVVVLALAGRLDAGTAGKLEEKLVGLIDAGPGALCWTSCTWTISAAPACGSS